MQNCEPDTVPRGAEVTPALRAHPAQALPALHHLQLVTEPDPRSPPHSVQSPAGVPWGCDHTGHMDRGRPATAAPSVSSPLPGWLLLALFSHSCLLEGVSMGFFTPSTMDLLGQKIPWWGHPAHHRVSARPPGTGPPLCDQWSMPTGLRAVGPSVYTCPALCLGPHYHIPAPGRPPRLAPKAEG